MSGQGGLGTVLAAPCDVVLSNTSIVQPALIFITQARSAIITPANIQGAPDLVVEVVSPSTTRTDQETKRDLYAKFGVRFYWVFEPLEAWARAYALGDDGRYRRVAEAHDRETFAAPPFADLAIPLGEVGEPERAASRSALPRR